MDLMFGFAGGKNGGTRRNNGDFPSQGQDVGPVLG